MGSATLTAAGVRSPRGESGELTVDGVESDGNDKHDSITACSSGDRQSGSSPSAWPRKTEVRDKLQASPSSWGLEAGNHAQGEH